jgi:thiol:disulfide interchange protein DsbC
MFTPILHRLAAGIAVVYALHAGAAWATEGNLTTAQKEQLKASVERYSEGKVQVDGVAKTPIPGLFEVTSGLDVFYVDATGRYAMVDGRLFDLKTKTDTTQARIDQLNRIDFASLPLHLAIKTVQGTGRRAIAIFEDPTCPICKSLHKFIAQVPDVTVYTFAYPVVSPDALPITQAAWCAPNRALAWEAAMTGNAPPAGNTANCDTSSIRSILALGEKLQVQGTPTVFLANGRRLVGATPPDQFIDALDELAPPSSK